MASSEQVKQYIAVWFQLGKQIVLANGQERFGLRTINKGDRYSMEFESQWQRILAHSESSYLEGTHQTIQDLLSSAWNISACINCNMRVPVSDLGQNALPCPCFDMSSCPDTHIPLPHPPINTHSHLHRILDRLQSSPYNK